MSKKNILARMFEAFVKDAEPEEVLEAAQAVDKACGAKDEDKTEKSIPTYDEDMEMVMDAIHELNQKIEDMKEDLKTHYRDDKEEGEELNEKLSGLDAVEAAIKERLTGDADVEEEEAVEVDPEEINEQEEVEAEDEDVEEESEVIEAEDEDIEEEEKIKAADSAMSMAMLKAIKPVIASMPVGQRRKVTDALNRAVKKSMKATQPLPGGYGTLLKRKKTNDAANQANLKAFGEACRKRNPHNK